MNSVELREQLIRILKKEFPSIKFKEKTLKSGYIRISLYVPNKKKNKRWMQLDANQEYLSIAMDHSIGDITLEEISNLNLKYGLNGLHSAIQLQKNNDAVNISIFKNEPYDFLNNEFIKFLHKHYNSYLKLVD